MAKLEMIEGIEHVFFKARGKEAVTTSRELARVFGKRHDNVLRKIDELKKRNPDVFVALKIEGSYYIGENGARTKEYLLNRDAFMWFGMSFTGKEADVFRLKIIEAFNAMEDWIKRRVEDSVEYRLMCSTLKATRDLEGKKTKSHHYSNEARMINWVLKGEFAGFDRNLFTLDELDLLLELQERNAVLIGAGMPYKCRKAALKEFCEMKRIGE